MLNSLQILRAVAAWMVVLHHFTQIFVDLQRDSWLVIFFWNYGALGVDLFFIISGFVIYYTTAGKSVPPGHFMLHRLGRILPAYWLFTLLAALLVYAFDDLIPLTKLEPGFLLKSLLFLPAANPSGIGLYPLLTVGWTLNFEMMFYLIFCLSLFLPERYRLFGVALGIVFVQMGLSELGGSFAFYSSKLIYEFLIGIVVAVLYRAGWIERINLPLAIAMGIASLVLIAAKEYGYAYFKIGIPLIVIAAISQENHFWRLKRMSVLGDWSYSTYLCHALVLSIIYRAASAWQLNPHNALAAACIVIVLISWLSYTIIERNISALIKQKLQTRQNLAFRVS